MGRPTTMLPAGKPTMLSEVETSPSSGVACLLSKSATRGSAGKFQFCSVELGIRRWTRVPDGQSAFEFRPRQARDATGISHFLRPNFLLRLALGDYRGAKAGTQVFRQFVKLRIPVDFDCLLGGVAHNVAVVAPGKVIFEFGLGAVVEHAVEVVRQIVQKFRAFHCLPSPLTRFWK